MGILLVAGIYGCMWVMKELRELEFVVDQVGVDEWDHVVCETHPLKDYHVSYYDCIEGCMRGGEGVRGSFDPIPPRATVRMKIWFSIGYLQFYVNECLTVRFTKMSDL